jgi:hypothetical protein
VALLALGVVLVSAGGCAPSERPVAAGSPGGPTPGSSPGPTPAPNGDSGTGSHATIVIPDDGIILAALGFDNGPSRALSLPRSAIVTARVDRPQAVSAVITEPAADDVARYLRRALPRAGFTIEADGGYPGSPAITFAGWGWTGHFTGTPELSAVVLRR